MAKLCPKGKAAAKRKFKVYPSAYANMYASGVCSGKITPGGKKNRNKKAMGGRIGYSSGSENYRLGTKFQGRYKDKSVPDKIKEFVKTGVKQAVGTAKNISSESKDYKLGTKFQGRYKDKSVPDKIKEFVKTGVKQAVGTAKNISKKFKNENLKMNKGPRPDLKFKNEKLRNQTKKMGGGMIDMTRMKYLKGGQV